MADIKPGTCIKFKNLLSEKWQHMNGKPGLVKKKMEDGRYRVMCNSKSELAVEADKLEVIIQCPYKVQLNPSVGALIWPSTPRSHQLGIQWVHDDCLVEACENLRSYKAERSCDKIS